MTSQEVYSQHNKSNIIISESIDDYYNNSLPFFNGVNVYDIANSLKTDAETANEIYNQSDEVEMLKNMRDNIPEIMYAINNSKKKIKKDLLIYFSSLLERIRANIRKFIDEIDNIYFWYNSGYSRPLEDARISDSFKHDQYTLFDLELEGKDAKITSKENKQKRNIKSINHELQKYSYQKKI